MQVEKSKLSVSQTRDTLYFVLSECQIVPFKIRVKRVWLSFNIAYKCLRPFTNFIVTDVDIFVNCNWFDTRWQYTFTDKQYI
jgi:hypothetical protein